MGLGVFNRTNSVGWVERSLCESSMIAVNNTKFHMLLLVKNILVNRMALPDNHHFFTQEKSLLSDLQHHAPAELVGGKGWRHLCTSVLRAYVSRCSLCLGSCPPSINICCFVISDFCCCNNKTRRRPTHAKSREREVTSSNETIT